MRFRVAGARPLRLYRLFSSTASSCVVCFAMQACGELKAVVLVLE